LKQCNLDLQADNQVQRNVLLPSSWLKDLCPSWCWNDWITDPFFQSLSPGCTDFFSFGSKFYSPQAALIITMEQLSTAKGPSFMWFKPTAETSLCLLNHTLLHSDFSLCGGHQMDWTDQMNCWNYFIFYLEYFPAILASTYNKHGI
jgi:hypothetical protein